MNTLGGLLKTIYENQNPFKDKSHDLILNIIKKNK